MGLDRLRHEERKGKQINKYWYYARALGGSASACAGEMTATMTEISATKLVRIVPKTILQLTILLSSSEGSACFARTTSERYFVLVDCGLSYSRRRSPARPWCTPTF